MCSTLAKSEEEKNLLKDWLEMPNAKTHLLMRGSKHGYKPETFQSLCCMKGPLLVLIQSQDYNHVFGGYSSVDWPHHNLEDAIAKEDDKSFIFSLTHRSKHAPKVSGEKVIWSTPAYLFIFGAGHDILLFPDCNMNSFSYSNFGSTYSLPEGMEEKSEEAKSYLAGSYNFKVTEMEVYSLN
jgi:hypothetical protein